MTTFSRFTHRRTSLFGVLSAALLFAGGGCKPSPPAGTSQATPPTDSSTPRQPTVADFQAFFQSLLPATAKVSEVKMDPPVRLPNSSPADNAWLFKIKVTLEPTEDLLALPSQQDADVINALVNELNGLVAWRNAYVRSIYGHAYGAFDVQAPAGPVPQLLVIRQPKDKPLAPIYGKVAAEWQVDHWYFEAVDLDLPALGKPRSSFSGGPTMVQGSPEAEAFLAAERKAIADAKQQQAAIEDRYAKDLAAATRPGTTYHGQISQTRGVLTCEVRFLETPGADPQMATFEIRVPQEPAYLYVYSARLAPKVPLNFDSDAAVSSSLRVANGNAGQDAPVANLKVAFVRGTGRSSAFGSLASVMLLGADTMTHQPFLLLDGHLKGVPASFNGDFTLSAEQTR